MPKRRRPETDVKIFAAGLPELSDDQIAGMAALARAVNRPERSWRVRREALDAEVRRRRLTRRVATLLGDPSGGK